MGLLGAAAHARALAPEYLSVQYRVHLSATTAVMRWRTMDGCDLIMMLMEVSGVQSQADQACGVDIGEG